MVVTLDMQAPFQSRHPFNTVVQAKDALLACVHWLLGVSLM